MSPPSTAAGTLLADGTGRLSGLVSRAVHLCGLMADRAPTPRGGSPRSGPSILCANLTSWLQWLISSQWAMRISLVLLGLGLVSLALVPLLVVRIPTDYLFAPPNPARKGRLQWAGRLARNLIGGVLLLLGLLMLVLPGQGVLTIIGALFVLDFPGKRRFERWLILRPRVLNGINSLRVRAGRPPLAIQPPPNGDMNRTEESD